MLVPLVLLLGLVAQIVAWRRITRHGRDVWRTLPQLLGAMGLVALVLAPTLDAATPGGSDVPGPVGALAIGAAVGIVLYAGTLVFVAIAMHVPAFARQTAAAYERAESADPRRELLLSLLLAVPGEELFWRGLAYRWGATTLTSTAAAALVVWLVYLIANLPSRSLPIIAGALVGGAVWGALAWWSGGVLAPLASHILWTGLMLARPPGASRTKGAT